MRLHLVTHSYQRLTEGPIESCRLAGTSESDQKDGGGMGTVDLSVSTFEDAVEVSVILLRRHVSAITYLFMYQQHHITSVLLIRNILRTLPLIFLNRTLLFSSLLPPASRIQSSHKDVPNEASDFYL